MGKRRDLQRTQQRPTSLRKKRKARRAIKVQMKREQKRGKCLAGKDGIQQFEGKKKDK